MLFPPILEALEREFANPELRKVLLPGCGLARLAYEIAEKGARSVETMLTAKKGANIASYLTGFDTDANDCQSRRGRWLRRTKSSS